LKLMIPTPKPTLTPSDYLVLGFLLTLDIITVGCFADLIDYRLKIIKARKWAYADSESEWDTD
jgi:hypothetical protein